MSQLPRTGRVLAAVTLVSVAPVACREAAAGLGATPQLVARNGDGLFAAFAYRFTNVQRDPKFAHARPLMGKAALTPGRLLGDTSIWTINGPADTVRALYLAGSYTEGRYLFRAVTAAPVPTGVGDERHFIRLTKLARDDYEWYTNVDHAVGTVTPTEVAAAISASFTAFEGHTGDEARAGARLAFPATSRHLGQLVSIDSLVTSSAASGGTAARVQLRLHPERVRVQYPHYAAYLDKYVVPSVYKVSITDRNGHTYLTADGHDGVLKLRLRAMDGAMVALDGPPIRMPDSLRMRIDFSAKFKIFRVGYTNLVADFSIERGPHLRTWTWRFRDEPDWHFPLAADLLIKGPLARPFSNQGAELQLGMRDDLGPETISYRIVRIAVRESAIMRWLGGLGATAFGDFAKRAEDEENRFLAALGNALRADVSSVR